MTFNNSTAIRPVATNFAGGGVKVGASTSTGRLGDIVDLRAGFSNFSVQAVGASTAWRATLRGSLDGTNFETMKASITATAAGPITASTTTKPYQFVDLLVTAGTTSTAVEVTGYIGCN